jgi:hypothetical protein
MSQLINLDHSQLKIRVWLIILMWNLVKVFLNKVIEIKSVFRRKREVRIIGIRLIMIILNWEKDNQIK